MRCTVLEGVKQLKNTTAPDPVSDGKRPIIRVEAVGLCGSDVHYWESGNPAGLIMGHEFSGTIADPGDRADLKVGDRVTCLSNAPCLECEDCKADNNYKCKNKGKSPGIMAADQIGAYAELFMPLKSGYVYQLADHVSFEEAAMTEPVAVTRAAVLMGGVQKGDKVVVAGGGIIGAMIAQWCRLLGAEYVALTEVNHNRAKMVMEMGYIDTWFDATEEGLTARILESAKAPAGVDVFFDCTGAPAAINLGFTLLKIRGVAMWVGVTHKPVPIDHRVALFKQTNCKFILGYSINNFGDSLKAITDGSFPVKQYHTGDITFDDMQASFEELFRPDNSHFKIILHPQQ